MTDDLLSTGQLAEYLGLSLSTVYQFNHERRGPRRIKIGKHVRYRQSDVDAWLDARSIEPGPIA